MAAAAALPPGPGMLAALAAIDPGTVGLDDQVTLLQLAERSRAAVEARQQRVLAAVGYGHARALVEETDHLDDHLTRRVEQKVLAKAKQLPVDAFRDLAKRAADRLDPPPPPICQPGRGQVICPN